MHFPSGKASVGDAGESTLRSALALARASDRIVIYGRTDSTASDDVNQALALARAHGLTLPQPRRRGVSA